MTAIGEGTELRAIAEAEIFEDFSAMSVIRTCRLGDTVIATGTPVECSGFMMVPIEPRGAVELDTFEKVLGEGQSVDVDKKQASELKRSTLTLSQVETVLAKTLQAFRSASSEVTLKASFAAWKQLGFNSELKRTADSRTEKQDEESSSFNPDLQKDLERDRRRAADQAKMKEKRTKKKFGKYHKSEAATQKEAIESPSQVEQQHQQTQSVELQQVRTALRETELKVQELRAHLTEKLQIMTRKLTEGDDLISKLHCFNVLRTRWHATALHCAHTATQAAEELRKRARREYLTDASSYIVQLRCFGAWRVGVSVLARESIQVDSTRGKITSADPRKLRRALTSPLQATESSRKISVEESPNSRGSKAAFVKAHEFEQLRAQFQDQQGGLQRLLDKEVAGPAEIQQVHARLEEQQGGLQRLLDKEVAGPAEIQQVHARLEEQHNDLRQLLTLITERPQKDVPSQREQGKLRRANVNLVDAFAAHLLLHCLLSWRAHVLKFTSRRVWKHLQDQLEHELSRQHHTEQQLCHLMLSRKGLAEQVAKGWRSSHFSTLLQRSLSLWRLHVVEIVSKRGIDIFKQSQEQLKHETSRQHHIEQQLRREMLCRNNFAERVAQTWRSSNVRTLLQRSLSLWHVRAVEIVSKLSISRARDQHEMNTLTLIARANRHVVTIVQMICARFQDYTSSKLLRLCSRAWAVCVLASMALEKADQNIKCCKIAERNRLHTTLTLVARHRFRNTNRDMLRCSYSAWQTCVHFVAALYQLEHALCEKRELLQRQPQSDAKSISALHKLVDDLQHENASLHAALLNKNDPKVPSGPGPSTKSDGASTAQSRQGSTDLMGRAASAPRRVRKSISANDLAKPQQGKTSLNSSLFRLEQQPARGGSGSQKGASLNSKMLSLALQMEPNSNNDEPANKTRHTGGLVEDIMQQDQDKMKPDALVHVVKKTSGSEGNTSENLEDDIPAGSRSDSPGDKVENIDESRGSFLDDTEDAKVVDKVATESDRTHNSGENVIMDIEDKVQRSDARADLLSKTVKIEPARKSRLGSHFRSLARISSLRR